MATRWKILEQERTGFSPGAYGALLSQPLAAVTIASPAGRCCQNLCLTQSRDAHQGRASGFNHDGVSHTWDSLLVKQASLRFPEQQAQGREADASLALVTQPLATLLGQISSANVESDCSSSKKEWFLIMGLMVRSSSSKATGPPLWKKPQRPLSKGALGTFDV
ncbi:hypothetical protein JZ751_013122 [Albula glossodonta]|uniref:Uncharacterized protein n=1 Tax=Albula glossodonta TaxID=121402 RepID=A0A8T2NX97_9TELE|nr:hypothetical protein JZ751_013122 [Albula glossodonta]